MAVHPWRGDSSGNSTTSTYLLSFFKLNVLGESVKQDVMFFVATFSHPILGTSLVLEEFLSWLSLTIKSSLRKSLEFIVIASVFLFTKCFTLLLTTEDKI